MGQREREVGKGTEADAESCSISAIEPQHEHSFVFMNVVRLRDECWSESCEHDCESIRFIHKNASTFQCQQKANLK